MKGPGLGLLSGPDVRFRIPQIFSSTVLLYRHATHIATARKAFARNCEINPLDIPRILHPRQFNHSNQRLRTDLNK